MSSPSQERTANVPFIGPVQVKHLRRAALVVVVVVTIVAVVVQLIVSDAGLQAATYPALFLVSFIGNASLFFPLPAIAAVCFAGGVLNPVLVGIIGGMGQSLGEITGYLAGFSGSGIAEKSRVYRRIRPWMERRGWIVILIFAFIPNPLFDIVGLAAGALRMPVAHFLFLATIGKTTRSIAIAAGCSLGYEWLLDVLQKFGS